MMNYLNTYRRYACDVHRINREAASNPQDFVNMTEMIFRYDLQFIAETILSNPSKSNIILLAGPSSSGKTTGGKKLCDEFARRGCEAQLVSMDDFYLGTEFVKKLPNGNPDFESVEALDIPLVKSCLSQLIQTGECVIPQYDFRNSRRSDRTRNIKLASDAALVIEGIHALNPIFTSDVPPHVLNKIYISVKQGIKDLEKYVLTNREIRCIRRIVRDYKFRRVDPDKMLDMWDEVVEGEKKYIRPYRYTSDYTINSLHIYEPCIMKQSAIELLDKIDRHNPSRPEADRLIASLSRFETIDSSLIPKDSLMREFIGDGSYTY